MGASEFVTAVQIANVDEAFHTAVQSASYEHGHGGYTGTIAEKHAYVVLSNEPLLRAQAINLAWQLLDEDDARIDNKWGPAGAIRFVNPPKDGKKRLEGWVFVGWASE